MSWAASPAAAGSCPGGGGPPGQPGRADGALAFPRRIRSVSGAASVVGARLIWIALLGPVITLLTHLSWHAISRARSAIPARWIR